MRYVQDQEWTFSEQDEIKALKDHYLRRKELDALIRESLGKYEDERAGLQTGMLVMVRNFKRKKFDPKWVGPAVIVELKQHSVKIKGERGQLRIVNRGDIKPYRPSTNQIGEEMRNSESESASAVDLHPASVPSWKIEGQFRLRMIFW